LTIVLDELAPIKTKSIKFQGFTPWYISEIKAAKRLCRKYEKKWRKTNLTIYKDMYKMQCHKYNKLLKNTKKKYVKSLITNNVSNKKKLF